MSAEKRSALMGRIKGRDTGPERSVAAALVERGVSWEGHCTDLPGRPDFVFRDERIAVFVDGTFWHGWRFPAWEKKLAPFWAAKIAKNRLRDRRVHACLRRRGWTVLRIWEHQLKKDPTTSLDRIFTTLMAARRKTRRRRPGFSGEAL